MIQLSPSPDDLGQRLDRYMRKVLPGARLGSIYQAIRTKQITINGKKMPESTKLRAGDMVEIHIDNKILKEWQREERIITTPNTLDASRILYADDDLFIYDKPAGLVVHSPDHKTNEVSLIDQIEVYLRSKGWKPVGTFDRPALAHRIDRETSGIIISCLNRKSYESLARQFRTRTVKKIYYALTEGQLKDEEGIISAPLLRINTEKKDSAKIQVDPRGDLAETHYKVLKRYTGYSLVETHPKTGRTHQIRVHFAYIGHPLIGDSRYGGKNARRFPELQSLYNRKGHLLHAMEIEFSHPTTHKTLHITSNNNPFIDIM